MSITNSVIKYQSHGHPLNENNARKCSTSENKGARISAMNSVRMKENFKLRTQSGKCSTAQSLKSSS